MDFETEEVHVGPYTVSIIRDDQYIGNTLRHGYEWDGWMRRDLPRIVRPGTDILDIGGNIGWNALMFSEYGPVHTFDPLFHPVISKNVTQNTLKNSVTVHPYGLSNSECESVIYIPRKNAAGQSNYGGASLDPDPRWYDQTDGTQIRLKKLDDVYTGQPSLIKLDVERHEPEVIEGAWNTITKWRPAMYIEILDPQNDTIVKRLEPLGYTKYPRPENNYLFICHSSS